MPTATTTSGQCRRTSLRKMCRICCMLLPSGRAAPSFCQRQKDCAQRHRRKTHIARSSEATMYLTVCVIFVKAALDKSDNRSGFVDLHPALGKLRLDPGCVLIER